MAVQVVFENGQTVKFDGSQTADPAGFLNQTWISAFPWTALMLNDGPIDTYKFVSTRHRGRHEARRLGDRQPRHTAHRCGADTSVREGLPDFQKLPESGLTQVFAPFGQGPSPCCQAAQGSPAAGAAGSQPHSGTAPGPAWRHRQLRGARSPADRRHAARRRAGAGSGHQRSRDGCAGSNRAWLHPPGAGGPGVTLPSDMMMPVPLGWSRQAVAVGRSGWTGHRRADQGRASWGARCCSARGWSSRSVASRPELLRWRSSSRRP